MQDIHIPVKWIAFWRCLRKDLRRGAVHESGLKKGEFGFFSLCLSLSLKWQDELALSLANLL